jgi:dipeptidyl aminopeptidase/acylaminoacyl peptidase
MTGPTAQAVTRPTVCSPTNTTTCVKTSRARGNCRRAIGLRDRSSVPPAGARWHRQPARAEINRFAEGKDEGFDQSNDAHSLLPRAQPYNIGHLLLWRMPVNAVRSCLFSLLFVTVAQAQTPPLTVAESSDYKATSKYADVVELCEKLEKAAPNVARVRDIGTSGEGRKIPLVILAEPPVATPEEASRGGRLVVFVQGNIHAGEVDGKEGVLQLARDIALAKERPLLKDLVIAIAPIVNPDGNERFGKNRPWQTGPDLVGIRENAEGFDLNRDFIRLETPEVRAMVGFYRKWNPALIIDAHTTDGSRHRYTLTYDGSHHPATNEKLVAYVQDIMLPEAGKRLKAATGMDSFFYGNFRRDHSAWEGFPPITRVGIHYAGLRGRIGILSESYVYASFKDRVTASREFVRASITLLAENKDKVKQILAEAEKPADSVALRHKFVASEKPVIVLGYEEEIKDGKRLAGKPKDYTIPHIDIGEPALRVQRPWAYLVPAAQTKVIENLQRHGIALDELREDIELDYQPYTIEKVTRDKPSRSRPSVALEAKAAPAKSSLFSAGTVVVRTNQRLGSLATFLLEPQAEDGLAAWDFFGDQLKNGGEYPVAVLRNEAVLLTGKVRPLAEDRVMNKRITIEDYGFRSRASFFGNAIEGFEWLPDGEHYLQVRQARLWKVAAATGRMEPFYDPKKVAAAVAKIPGIDAKKAEGLSKGTGYRTDVRRASFPFETDEKKTGFLFEQDGYLYYAAFDGSQAAQLTKGKVESPTFSPDGKWVAFVRDHNLYAVDIATQTEHKLTSDGGGKISNGKADWVYFEEIFDRHHKAFWWSPDSRRLAFLRFDDTPVQTFTVVDNVPVHQKLEQTPYPLAGDPNPTVQLGLVSAAGGDVQFPDLKSCSQDATVFIRLAWQPDGRRLLLLVADRAQTWVDVCAVPAAGGTPTKLFRETTKAWVADNGKPHFLNDGSFLFSSERTGWQHLFHYSPDGKLLGQVTKGEWEAREVHHIDEKQGVIYVAGTKDSPIGENLYRCSLRDGRCTALTTGGTHRINMSPTGAWYIDTFSNHTTPNKVRMARTDGSQSRWLDTNPVYALEEYELGNYELVHIPMKDGFMVEGSVLLPVDFDAKKAYPVWFMTYAGPHAPTISDSWAGGRISDHALASLGIIIFRCDPRSASGKGAISAWSAYRQLGVQELKDIEEAIDWLCAKYPCIDPAKVGMSGHSYGGFMTSYCLTHSKKFCAGIAGAPVTDWRNYDTIYTERYMNTPKENPDGYARTSVVGAAKDLHGRLLILHGLIDDNVHVQNTVQFMDELQRANKEFEVMFYPKARHGIFGSHYQKTMLDFIRKSLGR